MTQLAVFDVKIPYQQSKIPSVGDEIWVTKEGTKYISQQLLWMTALVSILYLKDFWIALLQSQKKNQIKTLQKIFFFFA